MDAGWSQLELPESFFVHWERSIFENSAGLVGNIRVSQGLGGPWGVPGVSLGGPWGALGPPLGCRQIPVLPKCTYFHCFLMISRGAKIFDKQSGRSGGDLGEIKGPGALIPYLLL